jgi:DNA mismatch repair protein MutL
MPQLLLTLWWPKSAARTNRRCWINLDVLESLGLVIEDFGGGAVLIRQIPADLEIKDAAGLIGELCQRLRTGGMKGSLGKEDEIISLIACKAAVKIGRNSESREWIPLVESVLSGEIKFCPHGRPVTMTLSKNQLEKGFKRK